MLTASADQFGSYNALRPLAINDGTGKVTLGQDVDVTGALAVTGKTTLGTVLGGGAAFPGSPATNDRFYRTDLGMEFFYAGSWLSTQVFRADSEVSEVALPYAATDSGQRVIFPNTAHGNSDIYLLSSVTVFRVTAGGTALGASHKWVCTGTKQPSGAALGTTIATIDSGASGAWRHLNTVHNSLLTAASNDEIDITWTKTGTPGTLRAHTLFHYRLVAV